MAKKEVGTRTNCYPTYKRRAETSRSLNRFCAAHCWYLQLSFHFTECRIGGDIPESPFQKSMMQLFHFLCVLVGINLFRGQLSGCRHPSPPASVEINDEAAN